MRKATLASLLRGRLLGLQFNQHLACATGLEGIVEAVGVALCVRAHPSWLKFKNPEAPAMKREAEEDWGRE